MESLVSITYQLKNFFFYNFTTVLCLTILFAIYHYYTSTYDHVEERGVKFIKNSTIFGSSWWHIDTVSVTEYQLRIYEWFKGLPFAGVLENNVRTLYIFDPDLIKAVTIKDFEYFTDRNKLQGQEPKYLKQSVLRLKGQAWKDMRRALTPAFKSSRLKQMFPVIELCSKQMVNYLLKFDGKEVEMKTSMNRYTLEVIGATAFGVKSDVLDDEKSQFAKLANQLFDIPTMYIFFIKLIWIICPKLLYYVDVMFFNRDATKGLINILRRTKAERRISGEKKNDLLQLLIDAGEKERNEAAPGTKIQMDDEAIDSQLFVFLVAGYETSSTLLAFAIHVLATKPEIQTKLRQHILEVTEGKEMSFELLADLTYLEAFLQETTRLYPPVPRFDRKCSKNYVIPGSNVELKKGDVVAISVIGVHMDPDIYKNPKEFIPERFIGDAKREIPPYLHLTFGCGPRNCMGIRFAMISSKLVMVNLLKNFEFKTCSRTEDPLPYHKKAILLQSANGIWIQVNKI